MKQGRPFWQREGIMVGAVDLWETDMDPQGPMTFEPTTIHSEGQSSNHSATSAALWVN